MNVNMMKNQIITGLPRLLPVSPSFSFFSMFWECEIILTPLFSSYVSHVVPIFFVQFMILLAIIFRTTFRSLQVSSSFAR